MKKQIGKSSLKWLKWGNDTYHTGYSVFTIFYTKLIDIYIIKYPENSYIPKHKDPSSGRRIYRVNFFLKNAEIGGQFKCNRVIFNYGRLVIFRADNTYHSVSKVEKGTRVVLSIGVKLKDTNKC